MLLNEFDVTPLPIPLLTLTLRVRIMPLRFDKSLQKCADCIMHLWYCFLLLKDVFFSIATLLILPKRYSSPSMSDIAESKSNDLSTFEFGVLIVKLAMFWYLSTSNPEISIS